VASNTPQLHTKARFPLPELTARVNGPSWRARVSTSRVDGPTRQLEPLTRAVNSASGNRALVCNWGVFEATEYRPLVCMEEDNQSGDLTISGGHGNSQEE